MELKSGTRYAVRLADALLLILIRRAEIPSFLPFGVARSYISIVLN